MFLWNKSSHPYTTMLISASQRGHLRKKSTLYSVFIQLSTLCGHCQEMVNVGQRYHRTRSGHVGLQRLEHPIVYAWLHYKGFNSFFPRVYAAVLTFDLQLSWKTWWLCHDLGQQACSVWWPVCPESLSCRGTLSPSELHTPYPPETPMRAGKNFL